MSLSKIRPQFQVNINKEGEAQSSLYTSFSLPPQSISLIISYGFGVIVLFWLSAFRYNLRLSPSDTDTSCAAKIYSSSG